ncbi:MULTISPECIES: hypothetical protein [unclassified Luteococcus]|uniref:hypothetical protein n=1 Tax=unclassified Luteococcus TaxID=2639923 RepID=UPI00313BE78D
MSLVEAIVFGVALLLSAVLGDLLHAWELPRWPHTVSVLLMAVLGGYLGSVLLVAAMLGAGVGWLLIGGVLQAREHAERRRIVREVRRARLANEEKRLRG